MHKKIKKVLLIGSALISINACAKPSINLADTRAKIVYRLKTSANNSINLYGISKNNMPEVSAVNCMKRSPDWEWVQKAIAEFFRRLFRRK